MGNAYIYYSFEEYGRGYIGARSKSPIGDEEYLGSYRDESFNPTQKIILAEYETWEEALEAEVLLHEFYSVDTNPHFANQAKQTSSGFYFDPTERNKSLEMRKKVSESWTEERRKEWGEISRNLWTEERRAAQAERMANQNRSERHREMMRTQNPAKLPEVRKKLSERQLGEKNHNYGKPAHPNTAAGLLRAAKRKRSSETKDKMRSKATGRKLITNGERNTWLYPGQEIPEGWRFAKKTRG